MKAKTKAEFETAWLNQIHSLYSLGESLNHKNTNKLIVLIHLLEDLLKTHTFEGKTP